MRGDGGGLFQEPVGLGEALLHGLGGEHPRESGGQLGAGPVEHGVGGEQVELVGVGHCGSIRSAGRIMGRPPGPRCRWE
jgi:hypothetical protein